MPSIHLAGYHRMKWNVLNWEKFTFFGSRSWGVHRPFSMQGPEKEASSPLPPFRDGRKSWPFSAIPRPPLYTFLPLCVTGPGPPLYRIIVLTAYSNPHTYFRISFLKNSVCTWNHIVSLDEHEFWEGIIPTGRETLDFTDLNVNRRWHWYLFLT